jgi:hypothetical protein
LDVDAATAAAIGVGLITCTVQALFSLPATPETAAISPSDRESITFSSFILVFDYRVNEFEYGVKAQEGKKIMMMVIKTLSLPDRE